MNGQNHGIMHHTGVINSPLLGQHSIQYVAHILIERIHGMMHHTGVINLLPLGKHSIQYLSIHGMTHHTGVINTLPLGKHSIQYAEHTWNSSWNYAPLSSRVQSMVAPTLGVGRWMIMCSSLHRNGIDPTLCDVNGGHEFSKYFQESCVS